MIYTNGLVFYGIILEQKDHGADLIESLHANEHLIWDDDCYGILADSNIGVVGIVDHEKTISTSSGPIDLAFINHFTSEQRDQVQQNIQDILDCDCTPDEFKDWLSKQKPKPFLMWWQF